MSRRSSGPDQFHQILVIESANQEAVDAETWLTKPLPIPRFGTRERPYVFELTKIHYLWNLDQPVPGTGYSGYAQLSTIEQGYAFGDPRTFWVSGIERTTAIALNENTNAFILEKEQDFTDSNGKGLLIGSDNIYLYFNTTNTGHTTNKLYIRLFYRLIRVSAAEYIGIVQSQA